MATNSGLILALSALSVVATASCAKWPEKNEGLSSQVVEKSNSFPKEEAEALVKDKQKSEILSQEENEILARLKEDMARSAPSLSGSNTKEAIAEVSEPSQQEKNNELARKYGQDCIQRITSSLKDPDSLRVLSGPIPLINGSDGISRITTKISATNSYGGRISKFYFCSYRGGKFLRMLSV
jgi:uncharacterized protein with von Willebrand factor type A (vWA) domain